ncbi:phage tail tape measure protein [Enterobacter cloacae complex sp. P39RS]|uniref:phage tail tape measure protein n=1 Tax=Enterobacter cloacae complex sp. P39RS TaxID=2779552 RepID=UPI00187256AA|nr:phage tail tape measure protein [Enterobacter cloacae complex sp. P39RS]MBE4882904.1 phage tail tape measure protein [Enterobacter cloacae complex sp. P39RS]
MANDVITQLQARNETLTQAIARYGSLNASMLQALNTEQIKITQLTQQLTESTLRREVNDRQRTELLEKTQTFTGQISKLLNVATPDFKLPYEFQDYMVNIAVKGGMTSTTQDALSLNIRDWSLAFNQDQKELQNATFTMVEGGITALQDLGRYMPDIAKAATATRDSAQIWAQAAIATHDNLNIAPEVFRSAQNMMYSVAKNGGSSIEEQTKWIKAFADKTGLQGIAGLAELTATLQIAMKNGSSFSAASENFDHFLKSTFSKETDSWFASQGVDLQGSLLEHQQNGTGVTEAMVHIVQMQLDKMNPLILDTFKQTMKIEDLSARSDALQAMVSKFNLGTLFGDARTLDFLAPMLANLDEYRQLKATTIQAASRDLISNDFDLRMASPKEQTKALQLALNDLWLTIGLELMPVVSELAQNITPLIQQFSAWLRENPALVQSLAKVVGIIWLFNGVLNTLKLAVNLIASPFIRLIDIFLRVKASLALGGAATTALSSLNSLGNGVKVLASLLGRALVGGLKLVGQTFIWLGRALLMNPVGLAITAIAGAAYLIYRFWEPISGFFSGLWTRIKSAFNGGIGGITHLILDWSPLSLFYNAFASVLDWFGIDLPASFSEFGSNILDSLVNGILNALPFLNSAIEKIKGLIPDWAKSTLGIDTEKPSPGIAGKAPTPGSKPAAAPSPTMVPASRSSKPYTLPSRSPGNIQVHFSPQVTVQSNGQNTAGEVKNVMSLCKRELEKMINDVIAQQQRRGYA